MFPIHAALLLYIVSFFHFTPCTSSEAPGLCGDHLLICFGLVSPDGRRFLGPFVGGVDVANSGLSHLLGVGRCSLPRSYHLDCPALRYTNTNQNRGPVILQPLPRGQTDWLCFQWRNFLAEGAKRFNTEEPGNRKEGRASNHGRQGRGPLAHFLFGQRSVGKDSKGLCAIFSIFEMGTITYFCPHNH